MKLNLRIQLLIILVSLILRKKLFLVCFSFNTDAASLSSNNSNEMISDESQQQPSPGSSTGSATAAVPDMLDNIENYIITTEINESGKVESCYLFNVCLCC